MTGKGPAVAAILMLASAAQGGASGKEMRKKAPVKELIPIQVPVVAVVEVSSRVPRDIASSFRDYITRERPVERSAFDSFKLVGAKNMTEARSVASEHNAPFILRVQLLAWVFDRTWKISNTKETVDAYKIDVGLELWMPNESPAAPKGSWQQRTRCTVRNYSTKSPGLTLMDLGSPDATDKVNTPSEFSQAGDRLLKYLCRSTIEVKTASFEQDATGRTVVRAKIVNHANIPVTSLAIDLDGGISASTAGRMLVPPGDSEVSLPYVSMAVSDSDKAQPLPKGPQKGRASYVFFGFAEEPAKAPAEAEAKPEPRQ